MLRVMYQSAWVLLTIGALLMFLLAARYFFLDLDAAAADPDQDILRELYLESQWDSTFTPLPSCSR
jgi:hypothetical protein